MYETDSLGNIKRVQVDDLQLTDRPKRLSHDSKTPDKIQGVDEAGHVIADRFGGSPLTDNLVSQLKTSNRSAYRKLENKWANAIKDEKKLS